MNLQLVLSSLEILCLANISCKLREDALRVLLRFGFYAGSGFKAWLDGAKLSAATTTTTTAMTTKTTARLRKSRGPTLKYDKRTCVYGRVASSKFCLCAELYRPCSWRVDAQRAPLTRRHEPYWY
uniref:Secreted protein n=1 Tax=Vespula pensylvanica TaxID=30213 RepID=A0A834UC04_VESPE|nr:hypothetical protein H0235_005786 [Vespula pensylvanica]